MPSVLTKLNIPQEDLTPITNSTVTVHGVQTHESIAIKGLLITPLNGDPPISLDSARTMPLPDVRDDVPSPQEVLSIPGLSHLAEKFPPKENWPTLMLIGRDCAQAQTHLQTVSSEDRHQLAIQTPLGWTIMGKPAQTTRPLPTCQPHASTAAPTAKPKPPHASAPTATPKLSHASASAPTATPKPSYASVLKTQAEDIINSPPDVQRYLHDGEQTALAIKGTKEDELDGYNNDERAFLNQVVPNVRVRPDRMIELPLPFREANPIFPFNRTIALKRTESALKSLKKTPEFFQKTLDKFALNVDREIPRFEPVPQEHRFNKDGHAYYIPQFSVNQKGKARIVFDSAAKTQGVCINDALRQGPDRNNALRGVIHRFRRHPYAITADVENMFHQFAIPEEQKTYLRFFWFKDNDPDVPDCKSGNLCPEPT